MEPISTLLLPTTDHSIRFRCCFRALQLAYLVGLPPSEVPSVEIARGDLVEVVPASYGVLSRAFNFWSGPGRKDGEGMNLYENVRPLASLFPPSLWPSHRASY